MLMNKKTISFPVFKVENTTKNTTAFQSTLGCKQGEEKQHSKLQILGGGLQTSQGQHDQHSLPSTQTG